MNHPDFYTVVLLLGLALIATGIGIRFGYAQALRPIEGASSTAPEALVLLMRKFMPWSNACVAVGALLFIAGFILTRDQGGSETATRNVPISLYYAAALGFLLVALTYNVMRHRVRASLETFGEVNATTERIARVHGNFTEYVPTGLVLLFLIEWAGTPALVVHAAGMLFTLGRYLHAWGFTVGDEGLVGRIFGIQITLLALCFMVVTALYTMVCV